MSLSFGWKTRETRESIWISDPALVDVSEAARQAWEEDGDASHLLPFVKAGEPSIITFKALDHDEQRSVLSVMDPSDPALTYLKATYLCFRMAVDFKGAPPEFTTADGAKHNRIVKEKGTRMLAKEFVEALESQYPGIVTFYGAKVFSASFPSEATKKASSQPSTVTQSTSGSAAPAPASEAA